MKLVQEGAVSAGYSNTNLNTGQIFSQHHTIRNQLSNLREQQIIGENQNVFDPSFRIGDRFVDLYQPKMYHTVTSSGTW